MVQNIKGDGWPPHSASGCQSRTKVLREIKALWCERWADISLIIFTFYVHYSRTLVLFSLRKHIDDGDGDA